MCSFCSIRPIGTLHTFPFLIVSSSFLPFSHFSFFPCARVCVCVGGYQLEAHRGSITPLELSLRTALESFGTSARRPSVALPPIDRRESVESGGFESGDAPLGAGDLNRDGGGGGGGGYGGGYGGGAYGDGLEDALSDTSDLTVTDGGIVTGGEGAWGVRLSGAGVATGLSSFDRERALEAWLRMEGVVQALTEQAPRPPAPPSLLPCI